MTYLESLEYIDSLYGLGYDLALDRIGALMESLGNPQEKVKVIHVAGTNGKGSCCSFVSSVLIEQGYNVGVYTSPHLEKYNERYTINNVCITDEDFADNMEIVKKKCEELVESGIISQPTVFEVVTALAFLYFSKKNVDFLVLEVGLGGRVDATNIVKNPLLSVIMSISMDHMEYLGNTIEEIAAEKGGIIKEGCPVVLYNQEEAVYDVIEKIAHEKNAKLYYASEQKIDIISQDITGTEFSVCNEYIKYDSIKINLLGDYQIYNCATALLACKALEDRGVLISREAVTDGMKNAVWSGRMEIVEKNPTVILDGAHNIDGIHMLASSLKKYFSDSKITLLVGILGDKEYEKMMEVLVPLACKLVLTEPNNSRKWDVDKLTETIASYNVETIREKDIRKAYDLAKSITGKDDVLCCAGSLYLIGELYKFAGEKND
ncbi:MAG: bifunctional folylpolyglutamate synthase/dihydrofolate synthase [Firmicutes bacterium]|nr:bifunctional folylpolyglutamate synthase/dihydrofolate synthase [Bacillota bacterium]